MSDVRRSRRESERDMRRRGGTTAVAAAATCGHCGVGGPLPTSQSSIGSASLPVHDLLRLQPSALGLWVNPLLPITLSVPRYNGPPLLWAPHAAQSDRKVIGPILKFNQSSDSPSERKKMNHKEAETRATSDGRGRT